VAAGDLLVELDYEPDRTWVGTGKVPRKPLASAATRTAKLLRAAAARIERRG